VTSEIAPDRHTHRHTNSHKGIPDPDHDTP
jgi:hypothetical protein